jgi:hypothetical protein
MPTDLMNHEMQIYQWATSSAVTGATSNTSTKKDVTRSVAAHPVATAGREDRIGAWQRGT